MVAADPENLIWIDLEMTGLVPEVDRILEIATVVTSKDLQVVAFGPVFAVHQTEAVLSRMDAWNVEHHTRSGLVSRVHLSTTDERKAEKATLAFLQEHVPPRTSPMCGNSICQDRRFLYRYMPELEAYFHYRHVDVSTFKELAKRWAPEVAKGVQKESAHQALADIEESIAELRYYRRRLFRKEFDGGPGAA